MSELEMSPERMRQMGYLVVDRVVDLLARLDAGPVYTPASPAEMQLRIPPGLPERPVDFETLLSVVEREVAPSAARWGHPRTFAYIPGRGTWPGALADFMVSALNVDASSWRESPAPIHLELTVIDWFRSWLGMPTSTGGLLVGGGSAANLTALATAREATVGAGDPSARLYCTAEAHSSVTRAARVLGLSDTAVRRIEMDGGCMSTPHLRQAIAQDRDAGLHPMAIVATAGATSTGAVDPLSDIADVAAHHGLWLHVDGAYGGFSVLTERGRALLRGIERADSVTLDPHKWLYQPVEVGALLVRDPALLERAFSMRPAYLQDTTDRPGETNMADRGLQQTRSVRALKVWMSVMTFGVDAFRSAIDRTMDLAAHVEQRVMSSDRFELTSPAQLSIVCFRRMAGSESATEALNRSLVERLLREGVGFLSSTRIEGRHTLRMCVLNHTTTIADVDAVLDWLESYEQL
jgi:aromatic-L-amino-acid/L-tryptophan decarboxylase